MTKSKIIRKEDLDLGNRSEVLDVNLDLIHPGSTNPRKHFDKVKLNELAESVRKHGVIQPGLARPLHGMAVGVGAVELVCGERRFRACKLAGLPSMPLIIRELDDKAVLEIQVIENLQRDDLHPLEEAAGYDQLIKAHGYRPEDIAAKVGKSKRYVYQRIQLLTLTPKVQKAFSEGLIPPSVADRLARIPNPKIQDEAFERIGPSKHRDECLSVRETERVISEEFMLRLKDAPFNTKAPCVVPVGGREWKRGCPMTTVGSCLECPKRTGNQKDLFPDIDSADVCTDPVCYGQKVDAHWRELKEKSEAKGQPVVEGDLGHSLRYDYRHADLEDKCHQDPKGRKWGAVIKDAVKAGTITPTVIRDGNEIIEVVPIKEALKVVGLGKDEAAGDGSEKAEEKKREALKKLRLEVAAAAVPAVIESLNPALGAKHPVWQLLADVIAGQASAEAIAFVAKRRGLCTKNTEANEALEKYLTEARTVEELGGFVLEMAALAQHGITNYCQEWDGHFKEACKLAGVDLKALEKETKAKSAEGQRGKGEKVAKVEREPYTGQQLKQWRCLRCETIADATPSGQAPKKCPSCGVSSWVGVTEEKKPAKISAGKLDPSFRKEFQPRCIWLSEHFAAVPVQMIQAMAKHNHCSSLAEGQKKNPKVTSFLIEDHEWVVTDAAYRGGTTLCVEATRAIPLADWDKENMALSGGYAGTPVVIGGNRFVLTDSVTFYSFEPTGDDEGERIDMEVGGVMQRLGIEEAKKVIKAGDLTDEGATREPEKPKSSGHFMDPVMESMVNRAEKLIAEDESTTAQDIRRELNLDMDTAYKVFDTAVDRKHAAKSKFKWNEHDVCLNPERHYVNLGKKFHASISLAESEGLWFYGYDVGRNGSGVGDGNACSGVGRGEFRTGYKTRSEAVKEAGQFIVSYLKGKECPDKLKLKVIEAIKRWSAGGVA